MSKAGFGFLGLGNMGMPMALSLAKAGTSPAVFDLRREALDHAAGHGARPVESLADLVRQSAVIGTCLLYDHQVRDVFLGPDGIIEHGREGLVATIHSTVMPQTVADIVAAARPKGIGIVDAPVSGGGDRNVADGLEGTLTLMIGADDWAWEAARPMLEIIGRHLIRVGGPGAGQIAKLGNNIMALCNQVVHMEAIRFVEAFGVSREALALVAEHSSGASWALSNYAHFDRYNKEHTLAGQPELPHRLGKDLRYSVAVAQDARTYLPVVALCSQLLPGLFEERWARIDEAASAHADD